MASVDESKAPDESTQGFMTKTKSNVMITICAVAIFCADTLHIFLTAVIGFNLGTQGRCNCVGMEHIFSPMMHTPKVCAMDAIWMLALEGGLLMCWSSSYKVQMLNIVFGITAGIYVTFAIGIFSGLSGQPPVPALLGGLIAYNYYWRVNTLYPECMEKYGKIFKPLAIFWGALATLMVISMIVAMFYIQSNMKLYKEVAANKGNNWPPNQPDGTPVYPDGVPSTPDLIDKAKAELEQIFFFPFLAVFLFLATILSVPLYLVSKVDEEDGEKTGLLPP